MDRADTPQAQAPDREYDEHQDRRARDFRKGTNVTRVKSSITLLASLLLLLSLIAAHAADEKNISAKEDQLSGTLHSIDQDASSIIVRKGAVQSRVVYNAETNFTIQNKPGSIDDVIVGRQVTCYGRFNDKAQLVATRVEIRSR
jgi:hypothetical protein